MNPAYTSQIGKIKYMKAKGISIHTSAEYCIARTALGYEEKTPLLYSKFMDSWKVLSKELKTVKKHYLYNVSSTFRYTDLKAFVKDIVVNNYAIKLL
ncbi:hypothetical protein [Clostridium sp.]